MNAAARLVHQNVLSRQLVSVHFLTRKHMGIVVLMFLVLCSALSIIYMTHTTRILHANYQKQLIELNDLNLTHGQLLLEEGTWMMQARIQQKAEQELGMIIPDEHNVVVISE